MKRPLQMLASLCFLVLLLGACGGDDDDGRASATGDRSVPVPAIEPLFAVLQDDGRDVLGTADGYSLYIFDGDGLNSSECLETCALTFIPFQPPAEGDDRVGSDGVDPALVGQFERADGVVQVSYGGRALYRFSADESPGDSGGEGSAGRWFHVSPLGVRVPRTG